jgi:hypothetical protein
MVALRSGVTEAISVPAEERGETSVAPLSGPVPEAQGAVGSPASTPNETEPAAAGADEAAVLGLFDPHHVLTDSDALLERLLEVDLTTTVAPVSDGGSETRTTRKARNSLAVPLDQIAAHGEPRFFRVGRDGKDLYNIVLEPLRSGSGKVVAVAVRAPRIERTGNWLSVYNELAKAHQATIDLRVKLLAALPAFTGVGLGLILANSAGIGSSNARGLEAGQLIALGVFGFFVSLGLFMYELRNIQECVALIDKGAALEGLVGAPTGQFLARPRRKGWISTRRASHLVYGSVLLAWLALTVYGLVEVFRH